MTPLLGSLAVDFAYTEEDEAFRAELQAWLDEQPPRRSSSRARSATSTPTRRAARWRAARRGSSGCTRAAGRPSTGRSEWGGREATTMQNVIYSEVMAQAKTPGIYNANGIWQIGPMIMRWASPEMQQRVAARDHRRHRALVPGLHRARGGQRPRQPAHARHRRRRRVRRQRHEDLDVHRPPGAVGPVPRAHRPHRHRTGRQARGHHRADRRHGHAGRAVQPDPGDHRRGDVLRGRVHRRPCAGRLPARRGGRRLERRHGHAHPRAGRHRRHRHRPARRARADDPRRRASTTPTRSRTPTSATASPACTPRSSSPGCSTPGRCPRC